MAETATMPTTFTDLADPVMFTNPFPRYAELRKDAPVSSARSQQTRGNVYMLTKYEDVLRLYSDSVYSSDAMKNGASGGGLATSKHAPRMLRLLTDSMVFKDDPDHKRLRGLVNKAFTPQRIQAMSDGIDLLVDELLDDMAKNDTADIVKDFAIQLPLRVISDMLGVSDKDRRQFLSMAKIFADGSTSPLGMLKAMPTGFRMVRMFDRMTAERRAHDDDSMIAALVRAQEDDDRLSDHEIVSMIFLLLLAGYDTTSNLIGMSVLELLDQPEQATRLRTEPELIDSAVEELLRFTTPVPHGVIRVPMEDIEVQGVRIPKRSSVVGMIISANRDESMFEDPDVLDLGRTPNKHITFAFGSHYCLGNRLARLEGRSALQSLFTRFPNIELAIPREQVRYKKTQSLRGLESLPVRLK
jgi:cytochrome P450 PksS